MPRSGVTNAEYWAKHGEKLLGAFMCLAGLSQHLRREDDIAQPPVSIEQLAAWVTTMAIATEPTINDLLRRGLDPAQPLEVTLMARHAATTFTGVAKEDHKIRSNIYAPRPVVDPATLQAALAQLPKPAKGSSPEHSGDGPAPGRSRLPGGHTVGVELADPPAKRPIPVGGDHLSGRCDVCGHGLRPGEGALDQQGRRTVIRCHPNCVGRHRPGGEQA